MFRCFNKNINQQNCFQHLLRMFWAAYWNDFWRIMSHWTGVTGWKLGFAITGSCVLKYIQMEKFENCNNISQYYCIFWWSLGDHERLKTLKPKHSKGCENFIQARNMAHSCSLIEIYASNAHFWALCCRWRGCSWTDYICSKLMLSTKPFPTIFLVHTVFGTQL